MKRKDLILKLIGEMSSYILDENPMKMVISLHQEEDGLHLAIIDDAKHSDADLEKLDKTLRRSPYG